MTADFRKIILLLAANFLFGVAIVAIQPPFEGFDETAHFSRLQSQAFVSQADPSTSQTDPPPSEHISAFVYDYYRRGPMPYGWIYYAPLHTKDPLGGYTTYHDFFAQPSRVAEYSRSYWQSPLPGGFSASPEPNWQYQHPGFYYELTGQVMKLAAGHVSLLTAMFILKLFSLILAFAGFCIGLQATWKHLRACGIGDAYVITAFGALYPFLAPVYFWEFARLGNDSMCLLLFGIAWALLLWHLREPRSEAWAYLGLCLGLTWLTKAYMIPVSLGILAFLTLHHIRTVRKSPECARDYWQAPLKIIALMLLVGMPLYVSSYITSGSYGSTEFSQATKGHFWQLLQHAIATKGYAPLDPRQILYSAVLGFVSWSQGILDIPFLCYTLVGYFSIFVLLIYIACLRRRSEAVFRLPLWALGPLILGLLVHLAVAMLRPYSSSTPGYYIHALAPAVALIYGVGLVWLFETKWLKAVTAIFVVAVVLLNFYLAWSHAMLFSGCAVPFKKDFAPDLLWFHPADVLQCTSQFSLVIDQLGVLAWPRLALVFLALAFAALAMAAWRVFSVRHSRPPALRS